MNKLSIAVLIAATAAATGYVVSKVMKNKQSADLYEDDFENDCCCGCDDDELDIIPAEDCEDTAEEIMDVAEDVLEDAAEAVEDAVEEIKD
ncbi:MAG: YtxH domain-containing protein [Ruminococcus sp.]|nr:YtxH domain-containing protein [Ruminococcus sp.]MBQ8297944.1 YtxH domain-containing protein [Ruminococcus sp.]